MPKYIPLLLRKLAHPVPPKPQLSPHEHFPIVYKPKGEQHLVNPIDTSDLLPPSDKKYVQSVVGALLYYARTIDNTLLPALNDIAMTQAQPTQKTKEKCKRLLDYVASYPNVSLRYRASNMQLHIDSDAAYLVAPKAKSRIAGYYYFKNGPNNLPLLSPNHPVLVECRCLRHVVSSAAEAETAGLFYNAQNALLLRRILLHIGHPQAATLLKTDNATANGFVHNNIHLRKSKTWDMRYYWLRDKTAQNAVKIYWKKGTDENDPNLADYHTKHHSIKHHKNVRNTYVRDSAMNFISSLRHSTAILRGCVISTQDLF